MSRRRRSPDPGARQQPVQHQKGTQLAGIQLVPRPSPAAPPEKRHLLRNAAIVVGAVALGLTAVVGAPGAGAEGPAPTSPLVRETPATTSVLDTEAATGEA
jgi:hypothetical protein